MAKYLVTVNNPHSRPMMEGEPCFVFRPSDQFTVPTISLDDDDPLRIDPV